jgi:glycosyltransferase involved in cell wall biosynthesis
MIWISLITLTAVLVISIQWYTGIRRMPFVRQTEIQKQLPSVTIIAAAKNEEKRIREAADSLLSLDYPDLEIVIVNDRSTDQTGEILQDVKKNHPAGSRLTIKTIQNLPEGWLGKNHALYIGAENSVSDWLLFTDGDIIFHPQALKYAASHAVNNNLDHLPLIPENEGGTVPYRAFHYYWSIIGIWNFIQLKHAGVGAFNFLRREAYETIGTHAAVKSAPDDDLKLGKTLVKAGYRQQLAFGMGLVFVQWYESVPEVINGLEKNLFAFMRYSTTLVLTFSTVIFLLHIFPFAVLFTAGFPSALIYAFILIVYAAMYFYNRKFAGDSPLFYFTLPLAALLFIYCLLRSAYKALRRGGIDWRGTTYSLKELKRKK